MGLIVHLNGFPGTGKLTIARALAPMIGARVLDNHCLLDPAAALFERGTAAWRDLRQTVRKVVFEAVAQMPSDAKLILTDALGQDSVEQAMLKQVSDLAEARGDRFVPIVLTCEATENADRLQAADRTAQRKLTDPAVLKRLRSDNKLLIADGAVVLEVTDLTPPEAAKVIAGLINGQT